MTDDEDVVTPRLMALRERRGLTNAEVAERTGLSRNTVRNAETGKYPPELRTLRALAEVYEVPLARLLDEADPLTDDEEGA